MSTVSSLSDDFDSRDWLETPQPERSPFFDRETWATTLLEMGSRLQQPLRWVGRQAFRTPTPLESGALAKIQEIFRRGVGWVIVSFATFPVSLGLGLLGSLVYRMGTSLRRNNFTHWRGNAPEKKISDLKERTCSAMIFDIRGWFGGTSLWKGVPEWEKRIDALAAQLKEANPDVLCLTDVTDPALVPVLFERLQEDYAHFFLHIGKLFIASKFPIKDFTFEPFRKAKDGFASFTLASEDKVFARMTAAHFPPHAAKNKQLDQMIQSISAKHLQNLSTEAKIPHGFCASGLGKEEYEELFFKQRLFDPDFQQTEETSREFPKFLWEGKPSEGKISAMISVLRRLSGGVGIPGNCILRGITLSPGYENGVVKTSNSKALICSFQV